MTEHTGTPTKKQIASAINLLGKALASIERAQNSAAMNACYRIVDQSSINSGKGKILRQYSELEIALKASEGR